MNNDTLGLRVEANENGTAKLTLVHGEYEICLSPHCFDYKLHGKQIYLQLAVEIVD